MPEQNNSIAELLGTSVLTKDSNDRRIFALPGGVSNKAIQSVREAGTCCGGGNTDAGGKLL
jgi:hypothetical protein